MSAPDGVGPRLEPGSRASLLARLTEGGRPLLALLLLTLLIKLLVLASALQDDPLAQHPTSDARYYLERAQGLAGVFDDPLAGETYHLPPLYPALLALVPGATDGSLGWILALQSLVGVLLVAATYLLARRRTRRTGALIAAGLTALYGPLTFFETRLVGDSIATAMLVLVVLLVDVLSDRQSGAVSSTRNPPDATRDRRVVLALAALLGVLLGAVCLLRPQALLVLVLLTAWLSRRSRRTALVVALAAAAMLVPSTLHNARAGGDLVLISDNGGINLWLAATSPPSGTFVMQDEAFGSIAQQARVATERAQAETGKPMSPGQVSAYYTRAALSAWWRDPAGALQRVLLRARALLENHETGVVAFPALGPQLMPPLALLALPFGLLLAAFAGAGVLLWGRPRQAPLLPALSVACMVIGTALVFFHYSRFRLPLVPLMAISVGCGVELLRQQRLGSGRALLALAVALGAAAVSWLPSPHAAGDVANGWTSVADARRAMAPPGDWAALEAARADLDRALSADPGFVRARIDAAELDLMLGRFDACAAQLQGLERLLPEHPRVLATRGILSLLPRPGNNHQDRSRGQSVLQVLRLRLPSDPSLQPLVDTLEQLAGG